MGTNPWHYITPYRADLSAVLQNLKEQKFRAGRYGFDYEFNRTLSALQEVDTDFSEIPEKFIFRSNNRFVADGIESQF